MMRVIAQPEPEYFDALVRQKGLAHLKSKGCLLDLPLPPGSKVTPFWRNCLYDLYTRYQGTCAYLCVFFEKVTGGGTVDHFIAKSKQTRLIYEWSNYRLACSRMNSRKWQYDDILDPFTVENGWFHLEIVSGRTYPNPALPEQQHQAVQATIDRLKLNEAGNKEMRARHFQELQEGLYTSEFLKKRSPFVWYEARRQELI